MKGRGQAGFTIPVTMLLVSVLMVLSTAIVAMTVASFRDAARTRNRAEILNVSEIGLKLAIAEIMPGLGTMPNAYWSYATKSASTSVTLAATPSEPSTDVTHEFQLFANVRNWSPFADWAEWAALGAYPANPKTADADFLAWTKGWWPVPRNTEYDDSYFGEDASVIGGKTYPVPALGADKSENWLINNPTNANQLAFPVRLGTSSVPVQNLYWYWLTEISPNTPTNTQLRNGGLTNPFWVNSPPKVAQPNTVADRDVGVGAWPNHLEYADVNDGAVVNYDKGNTSFSLRQDRYNFLNTPVLKKIFTVDHRGDKFRVAVYCRMIMREYFIDSDKSPADYPKDAGGNPRFLNHMRRQSHGGGPNVIFYLVAVNESTATQRGVRVQQAIYVPVGPGNPQDPDATIHGASMGRRFADNDGAMFPGTMNLLMDKKLMEGATISGQILPASGDLSYRVPQPPVSRNYATPTDVNAFHPHWVYLIEWNGLDSLLTEDASGNSFLSTNSALIWRDQSVAPARWRRTPFRNDNNSYRIMGPKLAPPTVGNGATPSTYADAMGFFNIGHDATPNAALGPAPINAGTGLGGVHSRWLGPGVDLWGGVRATRASMSYIITTDLQIPDQENANARFGRPTTATRSTSTAPTPEP